MPFGCTAGFPGLGEESATANDESGIRTTETTEFAEGGPGNEGNSLAPGSNGTNTTGGDSWMRWLTYDRIVEIEGALEDLGYACEDVCEGAGYGAYPQELRIEVELDKARCMASARIVRGEDARVGLCACYSVEPPKLVFDDTPAICTGTRCGDVKCGESITCTVGDETVVSTCSWNGWKKVGEDLYVPA